MDEPLNILHIVSNLQNQSTRYCVRPLIQSLKKQGIQSAILCLNYDVDAAQAFKTDGITVYHLDRAREDSLSYALFLSKFLKSKKPAVVHTHNALACQSGSLAAALAGMKRVTTFYSEIPRKFSKFALSLNSKIIFANDFIKKESLKHHKVHPAKIETIYCGIDTREFNGQLTVEQAKELRRQYGLRDNSFVVGNIADFQKGMDHETLLKAFRKMVNKKMDAELVCVGSGETRGRIEQLVNDYALKDRVKFIPAESNIAHVLKVFDVFVSAAFEPFGTHLPLKAMASGKPVIATQIATNPEVIQEGATGYLVPCGFPERIETAIVRLHVNRALHQKLSEAARQRVRDVFSMDVTTRKYSDLYKAL